MAQTLTINNYGSTNLVEQTRLDADIITPISAIIVQNNQRFALHDYVLLGTPGSETAEIVVVNTLTAANTLNLDNPTKLPHNRYDYCTKLYGNQLRIYRAPNVSGLQPTDDLFAAIATVDIDEDQNYTLYTDDVGSGDYWYKFTYFNATTSAETNLSDSKASRGGGTGDYCSIDAIRIESGFRNAPYVTDDMIDVKRKAAQTEIDGTLHGFYPIPFTPPVNPFIADICVRLASGLLLVEQYGQLSTLNTSNGQKKIDEARADLQKLATKQMVLTDTTGASIAQPGSTGAIEGWPNQDTSSAPASQGGSQRMFRISDVQGQPNAAGESGHGGNLYYGRKW